MFANIWLEDFIIIQSHLVYEKGLKYTNLMGLNALPMFIKHWALLQGAKYMTSYGDNSKNGPVHKDCLRQYC